MVSVLVLNRKMANELLARRVRERAEAEGLLRIAELDHVAVGISHALAQPLQVASFRLTRLADRIRASSDGRVDTDLESAVGAMDELVSKVLGLQPHGETDSAVLTWDSSPRACLDHVRALTLARVRHTNLEVDFSSISSDARWPVDFLSGARLAHALLTTGSELLRDRTQWLPKLSLAVTVENGATVVSMLLGVPPDADGYDAAFQPFASPPSGPTEPLATICDEYGWTWSVSSSSTSAAVELEL